MRHLGIIAALFTLLALSLGCELATDEDADDEQAPLEEPQVCGEPELLASHDEVMDALQSGRQVRAILHYSGCTMYGEPGPDSVGGMVVEAFEWFDEGVVYNDEPYVAFSRSNLVLMYNDHVYDYVKVRVYESGRVQIIAEYIDPETFDLEMHEEMECELDEGDGGSVAVYAY
jgi:hypothetical protein